MKKKLRLRSKRARTYPDATWKKRLASVAKAQRAVTRAEERARDFVEGHMIRHPLTAAQKASMVVRVQSGKGICCEEGLTWLRAHVDSVWARALNGWAYEALMCCDDDDIPRQVEKLVAVLKKGIPRYYFL
jgi:hypothetical protein